MPKSLCRLPIYVNHALVANFGVTNMSFNAIRENKILAKISGFTVITSQYYDFTVGISFYIVSLR